jgi:hypothetical protein
MLLIIVYTVYYCNNSWFCSLRDGYISYPTDIGGGCVTCFGKCEQKWHVSLGVVAHACNPATQEVEIQRMVI